MKRLLALFALAVLLLGLTACGEKKEEAPAVETTTEAMDDAASTADSMAGEAEEAMDSMAHDSM